MELRIVNLNIEGFRAFRRLAIDGLSRVNLITGRNNTGKSTVLEALRILASDASLAEIRSILRYREEDIDDTGETAPSFDAEGGLQLSSLFNGFPNLSDQHRPVSISASGGQQPMRLKLDVVWVSEERDEEGKRSYIPQQADLFGEGDGTLALVTETNGSKRFRTMERLRRYRYRGPGYHSDVGDEPSLPCVSVSPYGGERTATLGSLWDRIALTDRENDVVEALQIIDPDISAVSMVGGEGPRRLRTAIVRSSRLPRPVPLRSFGDGLNRMFGIIVSLVNAKDGLLLIDEFENGMHHSVQLDAWRAVFKMSRSLGVQVFATSHSWDAIEAFQKAAAKSPEDGVLVRLSQKAEDIVPTIFGEDELAVATRDRIEVR